MSNQFIKAAALMAATTAIGVCAPNLINNQTISTPQVVHATSVQSAPWETDVDSNLAVKQTLHNGNEIYYSLSNNATVDKRFTSAVAAWNRLGVIKLVQVDANSGDSQIKLQTSATELSDNSEAQTFFQDTYNDNSDYATIINCTITVEPVFNTLTAANQVVTLEHELGHALGFAHDNQMIY